MSMAEMTLTIGQPGGLHLRAAAELVQTAAQFSCQVWMQNLSRPGAAEIDAKSMFSMLQSGVTQGQKIRLRAEGSDAEVALAALRALIEQTSEDA
jgi:phosphotransferase system HPr (HPr) family protein